MRVSEETLKSGRLCMGWKVSGLLLGAYNITHQQHFLVGYCVGVFCNYFFVSECLNIDVTVK